MAGERYNPEEIDTDPIKVVPKSDEQRKRLQNVSQKIMLLNRLDEVCILSLFRRIIARDLGLICFHGIIHLKRTRP